MADRKKPPASRSRRAGAGKAAPAAAPAPKPKLQGPLPRAEWGDPIQSPWHPIHARKQTSDERDDWSRRCRDWCALLARERPEQTLGALAICARCQFPFVVRTSRYHLQSTADVYNYGTCCNPDCKYEWEDVS
jgi:hypothetical protein